MTVLTVFFTLSLLSSVAMADTYCYYNSFGDVVCRQQLSSAARIAIAVVSFVVVFAILLAFAMYRRRKIAQANMAFVHASQNQQQGFPNQYPPPPPQGSFGGDGQKEHHGYDPQQYNGQYNPPYNGQYNQQHNGQYGSQQYNSPQYPPAAYDQGGPGQPTPPYHSYPAPSGPPPHH